MTIKLYRTSSPPNKINKSLTTVRDAEGYLRDSCSLMNPVITFSSSAMNTFNDVNYMYIPDFERYYFVDEVTSVANHLIQVKGTVDPLYTYKSQILNTNVVLNRTSKKAYYSKMIPDNQMKIKPTSEMVTKFFSNGKSQSGWSIILATT